MKRLLSLITILIISETLTAQVIPKKQFPVGAQCQSVMKELTDLHKQTLKLFDEKNYDEAYPLAKKMSALAEENCVEAKDKRLMLATNVADMQIKRGKTDEAREIYDKNLALAAEVHGATSAEFNGYLNLLIKLSINRVSDEEFEQYALKSVEVKKSVFGIESYEAAKELLRIAVFYRKTKNFEKAEPYYLEAVTLSDKTISDEKIQKLSVINQYRAYLLDRYGEKEGGKKADEFMKARTQVYTTADNRQVLNGMATKLVKPSYPSDAFVIRAQGKVEVEVTIGEDGKVVKAKAVSGHPFLRLPSEQAAKASTFLPTYIDGKPIIVTGVIVYNF